jgi:ABC-type uncharacterized transport system permease subunit
VDDLIEVYTSVSNCVGSVELISILTIPVVDKDDLREVVSIPLILFVLFDFVWSFSFACNIFKRSTLQHNIQSLVMSASGVAPLLSTPRNIFLLTFWIFFTSVGYNVGNGIGTASFALSL